MNRRHGSPLAQHSRGRFVAALAACALGALALLLIQPSAQAADSVSVTLGTSDFGNVSLDYDGTVTFTAVSKQNLLNYTGVVLSSTSLNFSTTIAKGTQVAFTITHSGANDFSWKAKCACILPPPTYTGQITVGDAPPPPPDSSTPAGGTTAPGGGTTAPGGGTTAPGGGTTAAGSSTPGSPASGSTTPGQPGGSSSGSSGGISIGNVGDGGIATTLPIGFNAPPKDPNNPTPTIPDAGTGVGAVPTGAAGVTSVPTSGGSGSQTLVEVANAGPVTKSRPTSLAIIAIGALAVVASVYAYRRLGDQVQRPGH